MTFVLFHILCYLFLFTFPLPLQSPDFSDQSGSTAAYFSRSSRRGSVISDFDDLTVPDLSSVSEHICDVWFGADY